MFCKQILYIVFPWKLGLNDRENHALQYLFYTYWANPSFKNRLKILISQYFIFLTGNRFEQNTIEEFAEQVFSALDRFYSECKHLSEVHVVIYDQEMAQKFIFAMQNCFESQSKPKGWLIEKLANYVQMSG